MNIHADEAKGGTGLQDDNALIRRVTEGDQQAFETLVLRHREHAYRQAAALVKDPFLAEDVVQECFADLYLHIHAYRPDFTFTTFLSALVRHKSIDMLRKRKHHPLSVDDLSSAQDDKTPESLFIRREIYSGLFGVLSGLDRDQRDMLLMYALEGMDYKQIATALHKSIPQVKIGLHRIRQKLKKAKEDWN